MPAAPSPARSTSALAPPRTSTPAVHNLLLELIVKHSQCRRHGQHCLDKRRRGVATNCSQRPVHFSPLVTSTSVCRPSSVRFSWILVLVVASSCFFDTTSNSCLDSAVSVSFQQTYWAFSTSSDFKRAGSQERGVHTPEFMASLPFEYLRLFPNGPHTRLPGSLGSLSSASDGRCWQACGVLFPVLRSPFEREASGDPAFAPHHQHDPPLEVTEDGAVGGLALPRTSARGRAGSMEAYYAKHEAGPL